MSDACDHNDVVVYRWRGRFQLLYVCVRCDRHVVLPGRWWTLRGMNLAARPVKAALGAATMARLDALRDD